MYEEFFGLAEKPFSLTPNPRYAFYSDEYGSSLQQLLYGIEEKEGFLLLTGMVGTGKTTLCREILQNLDAHRYCTALIFNPFLNGTEMLEALLTEFGCSYPPGASKRELLERLNRFLLSKLVAGYICVAIFDEAQHLSAEFLEQIRVLSNLETESEKLLQIVLVGQPELRERIQQPSLAQLDQRVSLRCTLRTLSREETERYIYHRLNVAGSQGRIRFTGSALGLLHRESRGVPRLINLICDRALLAGFVARSQQIGRLHVRKGIRALRGNPAQTMLPPSPGSRRGHWRRTVATLAVAAGLVLGYLIWATGVLP